MLSRLCFRKYAGGGVAAGDGGQSPPNGPCLVPPRQIRPGANRTAPAVPPPSLTEAEGRGRARSARFWALKGRFLLQQPHDIGHLRPALPAPSRPSSAA